MKIIVPELFMGTLYPYLSFRCRLLADLIAALRCFRGLLFLTGIE